MGIFYSNITVKNVDQAAAAKYLEDGKRQAYVSQTSNGYTVVFDKDADDSPTNLQDLCLALSKVFRTVAFAVVVHDGDVFYYWLYEKGKLLDDYDSRPGSFESEPILPPVGNSKELCRACQKPDALSRVRDIFERVYRTEAEHGLAESYPSGEDIHKALVEALNMPRIAVCTSYYTIVNDALPTDYDKHSLVRCGR